MRTTVWLGFGIVFAAAVVANAFAGTAGMRRNAFERAPGSVPYARLVGEQGKLPVASDHLAARGKELHAKLHETYQKLIESNALKGGLHGTDATEAVLPYIPVGISFADAEAILRGAGFVIERPRIENEASNPNRAEDWYAVIAKLSPFARIFLGKVDLYLSLLPKSPGDYTTVSKIRATFYADSL